VEPNATSVLEVSFSSFAARAKNSMSFGFAPGHPPSMKCTPRKSNCSAMRNLSSTDAETPSTCNPSRSVVSNTSIMLLMLVPSLLGRVVFRRAVSGAVSRSRETEKPPWRRLTAHENEPVRYRIMMIDATAVAMRGAVTTFIDRQSTGSRLVRQRGGR